MEHYNRGTDNNIAEDIKLLLINMPDDLSELEKIRWIYMKVGQLFSYDYRVSADINIGKRKVNLDSDYISNYQTCYQISQILSDIYTSLGIKNRVIEIVSENAKYDVEHVANEVETLDGYKYLIDLTVDLYLIQSGCMTRSFATHDEKGHDTINESRLASIDEHLGLIKNGEYTDKTIRDKKSIINGLDYSNLTYDEELIYKLDKIRGLIPNFNGYNEGKMFVQKLLRDFDIDSHEFNLIYNNDEKKKMIGCFLVFGDENIWYIYAGNAGLIRTDSKKLMRMMEKGWSCKSLMFNNIIEEEANLKK